MRPAAEADLRYPWERGAFVFFACLNLAILLTAIGVAFYGADWLKRYPLLEKRGPHMKAVAIAAIAAIPARVILRNRRRAVVRGGSALVSSDQFPEIYSIFLEHCHKLQMDPPELYISEETIKDTCRGYSTFHRHFVVIKTTYLQSDLTPMLETLSFQMGRELGRIHLRHTEWWNELLIAYVLKIPYLRNPLMHFRNFTYDRYGAYLEPQGLLGLTAHVFGRRTLHRMNIEPYLAHVQRYQGFWPTVVSFLQEAPPVAMRVHKLYEVGLFDRQVDLQRFQKKEPLHA